MWSDCCKMQTNNYTYKNENRSWIQGWPSQMPSTHLMITNIWNMIKSETYVIRVRQKLYFYNIAIRTQCDMPIVWQVRLHQIRITCHNMVVHTYVRQLSDLIFQSPRKWTIKPTPDYHPLRKRRIKHILQTLSSLWYFSSSPQEEGPKCYRY